MASVLIAKPLFALKISSATLMLGSRLTITRYALPFAISITSSLLRLVATGYLIRIALVAIWCQLATFAAVAGR